MHVRRQLQPPLDELQSRPLRSPTPFDRPTRPRRYTRGTGDTILAGDAPFSGQALGLLFNLAVGGVHSGVDRATCLATLKTEQSMLVDWVRVYTKKVRQRRGRPPIHVVGAHSEAGATVVGGFGWGGGGWVGGGEPNQGGRGGDAAPVDSTSWGTFPGETSVESPVWLLVSYGCACIYAGTTCIMQCIAKAARCSGHCNSAHLCVLLLHADVPAPCPPSKCRSEQHCNAAAVCSATQAALRRSLPASWRLLH